MDLDPKEVLYHLNQMGYKNITATQLKYFMKDLKKLIAFETKSTKCNKGSRNFVQECMKSLTAGAIKDSPVQERTLTSRESQMGELQPISRKISRGVCTDQKKIHRADDETRPKQELQFNKENISRSSSSASKASTGIKTFTVEDESSQKGDDRVKMWIRTSRPKSLVQKNDPVELYHKYKKEWEKHKQFIPGENDHSELRWRIRSKLLS